MGRGTPMGMVEAAGSVGSNSRMVSRTRSACLSSATARRERALREDDREGHAVPPRLPRAAGGIGAERHRSGRLRVEMECADQVVTDDRCTYARSQVLLLERAVLRIAFDHEDARRKVLEVGC